MATSESVGAVVALWRFPVKSMLGEQLDEADLTEQGVVGDRAYALIDRQSGKVVRASNTKLFPHLFACRASFVAKPPANHEPPPVCSTLPDGHSVTGPSSDADAVLSTLFEREVTLTPGTAEPLDRQAEEFTIDPAHPDIEKLHPIGHRAILEEVRRRSAFFDRAGLPSPASVASFLDLFPVSVLTTSTLDQLNQMRPESRFDQRRFRMNLILGTPSAGFAENEWVGRALLIGEGVRLRVALPDPRCVMATLAQGDLPKDTEILRTLTRHNRLQVGVAGQLPCAGVYALVESAGTARVGDRIALS
ncbi:MAG: MOSC domain-containing protein [Actinomycetota bacterium]